MPLGKKGELFCWEGMIAEGELCSECLDRLVSVGHSCQSWLVGLTPISHGWMMSEGCLSLSAMALMAGGSCSYQSRLVSEGRS